MGMSYGAALQSGSNAILYRHQRSFTPTPPRAKLSREEPDAGNLHVRVCEGWGWQHPHLLGRLNDLMAWNADQTRMPRRMHSEYLRSMFLRNDLAGGHFMVGGRPIAMRDIRVPIFALG